MAGSTFQTNQYYLQEILKNCDKGALQLPDFQRSWVWDEDRIKSLIASISRAFPVGALMTLDTGGPVSFKPRPVEGSPAEASKTIPQSLLLDGQQRVTSLYQVALRGQVVNTVTPKNKKVRRWFYIDIRKALDDTSDREDAIVGVPEDKIERTEFGRHTDLDLSTAEKEYERLMFPVCQAFNWDDWQDGFQGYWKSDEEVRDLFKVFKNRVLKNFDKYQMPVIALDKETSKEAVCVVFEKVNTGGKALDAFELVTAMYAASGHELRKDWYGDAHAQGRHRRLCDVLRFADADNGILAGVKNTDFLHAISLFYTREKRREAEQQGKSGRDLPAVSGNRQAILDLPLESYKKYEMQVEQGFVTAAKFLHTLHIFRIYDLPYQTQIIPLAAILADIGDDWQNEANRSKLVRWYWSGVFGELYGSAVETRIGKDFLEVPAWLKGGAEPDTVSETTFRADRLKTMRMRLSAAYKGMNALLMKQGAEDFRSGQRFDHTVFFGENVDIHHIFPKAWCAKEGIPSRVYDSIINKTPLSFQTNRIIGGDAPSEYIRKLEVGSSKQPAIASEKIDVYLASHLIEPRLIRENNFKAFMEDRQKKLLGIIEQAMGKPSYPGSVAEDGDGAEEDWDTAEAAHTMSIVSTS
jgi:hypothetical protein